MELVLVLVVGLKKCFKSRKIFKLKTEENAALVSKVADFKRVLQLDLNYNIYVQRCPVFASVEEITTSFFHK